jgi:F-type H+-transporting ATPase subunit b
MILASSNFGLTYGLEWLALLFFAWFVYRYVINGGLKLRQRMSRQIESIREQLSAGEQLREESEQLLEVRQAALARAQAEAESIVAAARRNATALVEQGKQRADEEYSHALVRAASAIELARAQIRDEVLGEIGSAVADATAKVVAAELDEPIHHRLIDEAITSAEGQRSV